MENVENMRALLKSLFDLSQSLNTTILYMISGSMLFIISTDYIRPAKRKARLIYLLLLPAWIALSISYYYGDSVIRWYASSAITSNNNLLNGMIMQANYDYGNQRSLFISACLILAIWLSSYLIWWVFSLKNDK